MAKNGSITVNEVALSDAQESTYSVEQVEQLFGNLQFSDRESDLLDGCKKWVTIDEVSLDNVIMDKVRVNNIEIDALYDAAGSISVMSKWFFNKLQHKPELIQYNRNISGAGGGEALTPVGECFIKLKIGRKRFRDRVMVIGSLKHNYILGQVLHQTNRFGTGHSTTGRHYITINSEMIAQAISQTISSQILKMKGKITLPSLSMSIIAIKTPTLHNTNNLYELNLDIFELPEVIVLLDIVHRVDHKTPQSLNIPMPNTNNSSCNIPKVLQ